MYLNFSCREKPKTKRKMGMSKVWAGITMIALEARILRTFLFCRCDFDTV